ncbi:hypothetical protein AX774_g3523 [Zancudomyces culisetae]|uniref:Uncharacterized protein n=1 Tax=Zancudomyces culisetae TaxID=1213189 RepID=A0A1R1PPT0_ZANCU|nr:hypothetical protein AX774_g3523 [Zancudomyces culisetae]|eukprot:OMH82974.1 hypothetical protein AX774_g3523 [Zancudomyces culisetae]
MFRKIVPCGLVGKTATSLVKELGYTFSEQSGRGIEGAASIITDISTTRVIDDVLSCFSSTFHVRVVPLETISPESFEFIKRYLD